VRLESIGKFFAPKSPMLSDSPRATASDSLDISGVMTALGVTEVRCKLGIALYLAKIGVYSPDRAVEMLYVVANRLAANCKPLNDIDGDIRERVLQILATFAYQDYSRSAASVRSCDCCHGEGFIDVEVFTTKVHVKTRDKMKYRRMNPASGANDIPSLYEAHRQVREVQRVLCNTCKGKGVVSNSCRCHGKGKVIDKERMEAQGGVPVWKECSRCQGRGYARLKFSTVVEAIKTAWEVKKTTAYDHIQPLFEILVTECHKEESYADSVLSKVTQ
jgi:hypothetical protein